MQQPQRGLQNKLARGNNLTKSANVEPPTPQCGAASITNPLYQLEHISQCVAMSTCKPYTTKLAPIRQCNVKHWALHYT